MANILSILKNREKRRKILEDAANVTAYYDAQNSVDKGLIEKNERDISKTENLQLLVEKLDESLSLQRESAKDSKTSLRLITLTVFLTILGLILTFAEPLRSALQATLHYFRCLIQAFPLCW